MYNIENQIFTFLFLKHNRDFEEGKGVVSDDNFRGIEKNLVEKTCAVNFKFGFLALANSNKL